MPLRIFAAPRTLVMEMRAFGRDQREKPSILSTEMEIQAAGETEKMRCYIATPVEEVM